MEKGVSGLTLISNDTDFENKGVGKLIANNQVARIIVSHIGTNPGTGRKLIKGEIVVELLPQGTLLIPRPQAVSENYVMGFSRR